MDDVLQYGRWRGMVKSAMRGRRGQALLCDLLGALDAMPEKRLIANDLKNEDGEYCALGVLGAKRGLDMTKIDPTDPDDVGNAFGISHCLAAEIVYKNDEYLLHVTPERRWECMRAWVEGRIRKSPAEPVLTHA